MKLLSLPKQLILFWYPEALLVFLRSFRNSILTLEEDLAAGLMLRLLFVPLFHDSSFVGRILSLGFRSFRIILGVLAAMVVTVIFLALFLIWVLTPPVTVLSIFTPELFLTVPQTLKWLIYGLFFSGVVLFTNHILSHPRLKLWKNLKLKKGVEFSSVWESSWVPAKNLNQLFLTPGVKSLLSYLEIEPVKLQQSSLTIVEKEVVQHALEIGRKLQLDYLQAEHFFAAILLSQPNKDSLLSSFKIREESIYNLLDFLKRKTDHWKVFWIWDEEYKVHHLKGVNRGWIGIPTPNLDSVSDDLTKKALRANIPDFVGRVGVLSETISTLAQDAGKNVLLVGDPGSGRTALVEYLAKLIISGDAPESFVTKRIVNLDLARLLSGVTSQGQLAERLAVVFEEVENSGNIVVFVDEIQNLGLGEAGSQFNLFSLIRPYIESTNTQFIASTDYQNYTEIIEAHSNFTRLFNKIELPQASIAETLDILKNRAVEYERFKNIKTTILALEKICELSSKYLKDRVLPDSALNLYQQTLNLATDGWLTGSMVESFVSKKTSLPVGDAPAEQKKELLNMEAIIHERFINQEEAVSVIAKTLRRGATGLRDEKRPIGSFLFVGPTGVGKTELAKILSEVYFKNKGKFLRFDMSEYQVSQGVERLIGRQSEEGDLTGSVRHNPYALILLDEFEKADPKIITLFLQVLDDGRLTDGKGKTVDFTNTIIVATSNTGSLNIARGIESGVPWEKITKDVKNELLAVFKPELLNRFDEIVIFKPLSQSDLQKIVRIKLEHLKTHLKDQGYLIKFDEALVMELGKRGFDPVLGARPLRRLIQDTIEARLSVMILEGKLNRGQNFLASVELLT
ncbi:MAG: ATP-dependent Clp protease ATP-binding subunit [Candidatus Daviesbacteria bacterium]|nr:ATP-dependent Clp protease ATP-binding subunit [Candidatus Daviesbacteria bacterium]